MQKPNHTLPNSQGGAQQQNISINISYNLNTTKIPKSILGANKNTTKSKKIHAPVMQSIGNQFFSNMGLNQLNEGKKSLKKQNLYKKSNESSLVAKQPKLMNEKKIITKKKKTKQNNITQPKQSPSDAVIEYYNPLANNSKHFLKRNIQSPDIFKVEYNRKLKTQASNYEPNESTYKKLKRSTVNSKETHSGLLAKNTKINNFLKDTGFNFIGHRIPYSLNTLVKKPSIGSSKTPKNRKSSHQLKQKQKRMYTQQNQNPINNQVPQARHNKSCMLYSTKKQGLITQPNMVEAAQHILSTYVSTNTNKLPRKRAQSAYTFSINGKQLVSKLLNMSMISSQLGSSQLISSQRMKSGRNDLTRKRLGLKVDEFDQYNHYQHHFQNAQVLQRTHEARQAEQVTTGNALRQYLNSIDLRIIKNIEDDTANIGICKPEKTENNKQQSNSFNKNSIDKDSLSLSIVKNCKSQRQQQKVSPEQSNTDMVSFYNKLFTNALHNKRIQQQQQKYLDSANLSSANKSVSIDFNNTSKLKKETFIIPGFDDENLMESQQNSGSKNGSSQVYEFVKSGKPQGSRKLNFQHYKDLLNKQAQKEKKQPIRFDFDLINCSNEFDFVPYERHAKQQQQQELYIKKSVQIIQAIDLQKKAIIDLIDKSFRPSQSPSSGSSLSQFKEEQVQRWNNINKMMNLKISTTHQKQLTKSQIIDELSKQSDSNNKWKQKLQAELSEGDSELISQQRVQPIQEKMFIKPEPIKSPKHSSRHKFTSKQPQYTEACWEYNAEELDKEVQNYSKQQDATNKVNKNVFNSPNNFSQDGHGSGEEQYDSKKYSQVSLYKEKVIQQSQSSILTENNSTEKKPELQNGSNSLIDSLQDVDTNNLSFEQKQIHSDNRWINTNFQQQQFADTQGRIRKFMQKIDNQSESKPDNDDYLECQLSSFGVKNAKAEQITANQHVGSNEQQQRLSPSNLPIPNYNFTQSLSLVGNQSPDLIQGHFKLTINGRQTNEKITLQVTSEKKDSFSSIRHKRLTHIVQDIILEMIRQFATDISYILKKSSYEKRTQQQFEQNTSPFRSYKQHHQEQDLSSFSKEAESFEVINSQNAKKQQLKKSQFVGKCFGIDTSFMSVQRYLKQFKDYLLKDENMKKFIIKNINKDIGPNSLQILSYLRPEYENMDSNQANEFEGHQQRPGQQQICQDEDGLFVVPSQAFSQFQNYLQQKIQQTNKQLQPQKQIILTQKQKRNTNFWHRGIYQSWNQFLDFQRPYGINGKPYEWVKERKKFRQVQMQEIEKKLQKGTDKLLEGISLPSGIIYDKYDLPPMYMDLNEQQRIYLNEQRLSRMLAIQLFQSEQTWINYNDQMAQLLVELSRIIQDRIFIQMTTEMKKVFRKRSLLLTGEKVLNGSEQHAKDDSEEQQEDNDNKLVGEVEENNDKWLIEGNQ